MGAILAYTSPAIGHLYPMMPLLLALRDRGHTIHVRTLASQVAMVRALGLEAEPIDPRIEADKHDDYAGTSLKDKLGRTARLFARRGEIDAGDCLAAIEQTRPDGVIVDVNCWGASFALDRLQGTWASFAPFTPPIPSPRTPPFGPGFAPSSGIAGHLRDAVARQIIRGLVATAQLAPVNDLRNKLGLARGRKGGLPCWIRDLLSKPPLLLVTTGKPFEYETSRWGEDVVMIGACAWEPPGAAPSWLDEITKPIVLVTTSSEFQDDGVLVRTALKAFEGQPVHVVATIPASTLDGLVVPSNATVEPFVPHGAVLGKAVVAITHGGMGATQKALSHGVPVCVVPFGRDQLEVARRVVTCRAGTVLRPSRLSVERIRREAEAARNMVEGARQAAAGFEATGGPAAGVAAIEERLLGRKPNAQPEPKTDRPASAERTTRFAS